MVSVVLPFFSLQKTKQKQQVRTQKLREEEIRKGGSRSSAVNRGDAEISGAVECCGLPVFATSDWKTSLVLGEAVRWLCLCPGPFCCCNHSS